MKRSLGDFRGLTGNQLKIIAMITMTCDHAGLQLFPQWRLLRILGRLALPVYAYMIAESCRHTSSRKKYLLRLLSLAALCQVVYFVAMRSLYMCILVTFSLSVFLICAWEQRERPWLGPAVTAGAFFICVVLPDLIPGFYVDYGMAGVLFPVLIYFGKPRLLFAALGIVLLILDRGGNQWWSLGALPLLMLYNGQRGRPGLGKFFYWYYPAHLAVIYLLSLLL